MGLWRGGSWVACFGTFPGETQGLLHLGVADLWKVSVTGAHGLKPVRLPRTADFVGLGSKLLTGFLWGHRKGDRHARRPGFACCRDGRLHGGTGGGAVVDEHHMVSSQGVAFPAAPVKTHPALEFHFLSGADAGERLLRVHDPAEDVFVEDFGAVLGDGAHGQFRIARGGQLAHDKDVKRQVELMGQGMGQRDSAAGEPKNDGV